MSANLAETCVFPPSMFNCHLNKNNRNGAIFRLHITKCVIFIDFWRMFQKIFLKTVFFAKNAYYKNGANTSFVLFHTVKLVWNWRQIMNSCLKYTQMRVKTLYLKWRHFLLDIMQNIYFSLIFDDFHQKMLKNWVFQHKRTTKKRRH